MVENKLMENLNRLGFPLMEVVSDFDVNETLAEVVRSRDARLWEGFPVLLANAAQNHSFDLDLVLHKLSNKADRENFHVLMLVSLAMYQFHHLSFYWANQFRQSLSENDLEQLKSMRNALYHDQSLEFGQVSFEPVRLKEMFKRYFEQNVEKTKQLRETHDELSLEYSLSQVFSPKQKELFKKKLEGLPLTKTEREYYSRTVRKKVSALANPELHRLAQKLLNY
jgi:transposase